MTGWTYLRSNSICSVLLPIVIIMNYRAESLSTLQHRVDTGSLQSDRG